MKKRKYKLLKKDCIKWMKSQSEKSIDCIVTSPPYNLKIKYGNYDDSVPRKDYLSWMGEIANEMKRILSDDGQIFLNVGYSNIDPFVAMDVAQEFRKYFVLQNQFVWVKHIAVNDTGYGQYKPITSKRFASVTTENIFHFTKHGKVSIDRVAIGQRNITHPIWPELYSEGRHRAVARRKIAKRMGFTNYIEVKENATEKQKKDFHKQVDDLIKENPYNPQKKKCIGNAWFIPYTPTSRLSKELGVKDDHNSRKNSRADHPATFPEALSTQCIKFSGIKKGSVVYDPFVGTGTTIVSALKLGMEAIGTDINNTYLSFAKNRVEKINYLNPNEDEVRENNHSDSQSKLVF